MNILSVEKLTKSYNEKELFEGITFGLDQGQKAALVGVNGCGKSTLMKIIAGQEPQEDGVVSFRKDVKVSFLPQQPIFDESQTVLDGVFDSEIEELQLIKAYEWNQMRAERFGDEKAIEKIGELISKMDQLNAWDYESQVRSLLGQLGIHALDQKIGELSGGQKKRIALAQVLVTSPDFLILDEPTNHLDLESIEWLESYLATANMTLLMVTHDRYFLDKVTNEILEIDQSQIFKYKGNYQNFLEKKALREEQEAATVAKAKNLLRKELDWMRRQPKARGTKAKYRVDAFYETKETASKNLTTSQMEVQLSGDRQGKKILEFEKMSKSFDSKPILENFSYVFKKKDRIGIVGPNGVGKTTFLNLLTGEMTADRGKREVGKTTVFGYYKQEEFPFDLKLKVLEVIQEVAEVIQLLNGSSVSASQLLGQFLFPPKVQHQPVSKLSGGERKRLQLLRVLMSNPNFLILDEPTNDLDLTTLNVLEDYLESFEGCLLIVSHDRYFMDRLTDHLFVFEGEGKIRDFPGNYTDLRIEQAENKQQARVETTPKKEKKEEKQKVVAKVKLSYKEQRELDSLEKAIAEGESKKVAISQEMSATNDYDQLQELGEKLQKAEEKLEMDEMRWLELSEKQSS